VSLPTLTKWIRERFHPGHRVAELPSRDVQLVLPAFTNRDLDKLEFEVLSQAGAGAGIDTFIRLANTPEDRIQYIEAADITIGNAGAVFALCLERGQEGGSNGLNLIALASGAPATDLAASRIVLPHPVYLPAGWHLTAFSRSAGIQLHQLRAARVFLKPGESLQQ